MSNGTREMSNAVSTWGKSLQARGVEKVEHRIEVDGKIERLVLEATLTIHPDKRPPNIG
jgi:hypothetical protein